MNTPMTQAPSIKEALELLPCPFCGGSNPHQFNNPDEFGHASYGVQCTHGNCWICGPEAASPEEAVSLWNTRATLQPSGEHLEAIARDAFEFLNGNRNPPHDVLDALGLEWRVMRKRRNGGAEP